MKRFGVYINPYPGTWFYPSRLKSEARHAGTAYWIKAETEKEVLQILIEESRDPEEMKKLIDKGLVLVEPE